MRERAQRRISGITFRAFIIGIKFLGLKAHRRAIPFFLGLILGDYVISSAWTLVGTIFRIPTYVLWSP